MAFNLKKMIEARLLSTAEPITLRDLFKILLHSRPDPAETADSETSSSQVPKSITRNRKRSRRIRAGLSSTGKMKLLKVLQLIPKPNPDHPLPDVQRYPLPITA